MALMREGMATPSALLLLGGQQKYNRTVLTKLVKEGYIADRKITVTNQKKKQIIPYKVICPKGVQWLIDNCSDEYGWLSYLPNPVPRFSLTQITNNNQLNRQLNSISASVMFSMFDITTYEDINETSTTRYKSSFIDMVNRAKREYEKANNSIIAVEKKSKNSKDIYYHTKDIKDSFSITKEEAKQYLFTTHIGLLNCCSLSYLIYASSSQGIQINMLNVSRTQISAINFLQEHCIQYQKNDYVRNGIIFCKNAREFEGIIRANIEGYFSNKNKQRKLLKSAFNNLYIAPLQRCALSMLGYTLYYREKQYTTVLNNLMKKDIRFRERYRVTGNEVYYDEQYPVLIGMDMNLVRIQEFIINNYTNQQKRYLIVCYEWEKEYYDRIVDSNEVQYYIITKEIFEE